MSERFIAVAGHMRKYIPEFEDKMITHEIKQILNRAKHDARRRNAKKNAKD